MRTWIALVAGCVAGLFSMAQGARAASSKPLKTSGIGNGPMKNEQSTRTGVTNSATCALEPIAMFTARLILFL